MIDPKLQDKVVLVTGGGRNIGAAISRAFAAQGARVAIHYLLADLDPPQGVSWEHITASQTEAELLAQELAGAVALPANLAELDSLPGLLDEVESRLGPIEVLVNNAAHCESPDTYESLNAGSLERHYRVNALAPALLIAELGRRGRTASVVNISTDAARAFGGQIGYGSSKAAVEALTRSAALDLGGAGIRVNAVAPGPVQTGWMSDDLVASALPDIPLGRVGSPDDIADAVVFLASEQARWITGQILQVAGGHAL